MKTLQLVLFLILVFALGLSACNAAGMNPAATASPTDVPIQVADSATIAEGRVVPAESVHLAFTVSGQVAEVLVKEGDSVKAGDVLARLGNREPLEAAIAAAESELLSAQQAYNALSKDLDEQQNQALQTLNEARQAAYDADKFLRNISGTVQKPDIDNAWAEVFFAKKALDDANEDYKPWKDKAEDNLNRARLLIRQAAAQKKYDSAVRKYNSLIGTINDFDRNQAETDLAIANKALELAQKEFDDIMKGPDADAVASAQARIKTAETQLASAKSDLNNLELKSTINGVIVDLNLILGENVSPNEEVVQVMDSSKWYVETDDLTEIEVVSVQPGQKVSLVPDALPDVQVSGTVETIADVFEEKRGEVTYTARILIDQVDPRLRWGMTVVVTFEE